LEKVMNLSQRLQNEWDKHWKHAYLRIHILRYYYAADTAHTFHQALMFINTYVITSNVAQLHIDGNAIQNWSKI
jgi:hypothetical protein